MKMRHLILAMLALFLGAPTFATAQEERERERELGEAQERVEKVQQELSDVLARLRELQGDEARRSLEHVMRELRTVLRLLEEGPGRDLLLDARALAGQLRMLATERRPQMGVYLRTSRNPAKDSIGAELTGVVGGGPADQAGLESGDIITQANGQPLARVGRRGQSPRSKLIRIKNELAVGDTLHVEYRRGSEAHAAHIVLSHVDSPYMVIRDISVPVPDVDFRVPRVAMAPFNVRFDLARFAGSGWLDIELVTLDEDLGEYFGTHDGLLVIQAPRDASLRMKSGDVILEIDGRVPTSESHLMRIVRSYEPGETMRIEIMRNKRRTTLSVTVPEGEGES